jgi:hypothetical protein
MVREPTRISSNIAAIPEHLCHLIAFKLDTVRGVASVRYILLLELSVLVKL